jgi:arylsulfatase A-like enzyme
MRGGNLNGIPGLFDRGPVEWDEEEMSDMRRANWAAGLLAKKWTEPTMLACGFFRPHLTWHVPKKYFDRFPLDSIQLPPVQQDDLSDVPPEGVRMAHPDGDHKKIVEAGGWKNAVQAYLASISFADECMGRVLRGLESGPNGRDTVVIYWSDHGWHLGEKQHWRKFTLWERSTRVALMMSAPGITRPGARSSRTVSLLDVDPTLVELLDLPKRDGLEGGSLMPLLRNPDAVHDVPAVTT